MNIDKRLKLLEKLVASSLPPEPIFLIIGNKETTECGIPLSEVKEKHPKAHVIQMVIKDCRRYPANTKP